ncbi:MAG: NUDIX hydrolase [Bacteroidetes bacterium]|nr:NUDIX hydrolase [Bacteroidota bacterium]
MENNPWITKKSEDVYESPWIKVVKHDVLNPAGKPATYSVVNFKNLAIGILPIDNEGFTWLVGQWRYPLEEYCWEIPEGGGPLGIDPLNSAKRELKEETGIVAKDFQEIMRLHLSNSATNELAIVYLAKNLDFESAEPEESEVLQVKRIHLNEAYDWVMTGKITDAISVAAILKTKIMMEQGLI